ncbi:MAG: cellulase family glycosylhydrolase [Armatimonadetes bacterium]|nr:cellulase family glycosylhydrolase [Armatimonadota bacterium]
MAIDRRTFLKTTAAAAAARLAGGLLASPAAAEPTAAKLPRWRGFNLLEKFTARDPAGSNPPFAEQDFAWLRAWGFDFVRLPMSYRCWVPDAEHWLELDEQQLAHLDQAVELGRRHGVHVDLNLHRAPGYCVNPPAEPLSLWDDERALDACAFHWGHLAKRFKGIPNDRVSFDLLNEPGMVPVATYARVVKRLVEAIHAEDPARLVIADGIAWGNTPVPELIELGVGQSTRGYAPMQISHYQASWIRGSDKWPLPTWPLHLNEHDVWDKERLRRERNAPWKALEARGVGVHVGEWGAFNKTPHDVVLAWMRDCLELWAEAGWGWSLWNFRGSFGVLDSGRGDVTYESFEGHQLDRAMLELLREH